MESWLNAMYEAMPPRVSGYTEIGGETWASYETELPPGCPVCRLLEFDCGQHTPIGPDFF